MIVLVFRDSHGNEGFTEARYQSEANAMISKYEAQGYTLVKKIEEGVSNVNLVGFIHQYGANDFSVWSVQLSTEDEQAINAILEKYEAKGISVRGDLNIRLKEVF